MDDAFGVNGGRREIRHRFEGARRRGRSLDLAPSGPGFLLAWCPVLYWGLRTLEADLAAAHSRRRSSRCERLDRPSVFLSRAVGKPSPVTKVK